MDFMPLRLPPEDRVYYPALYDALVAPTLYLDALINLHKGGEQTSTHTIGRGQFQISISYDITLLNPERGTTDDAYFYRLVETEVSALASKALHLGEKTESITLKYEINYLRIYAWFHDARACTSVSYDGGKDPEKKALEKIDSFSFRKAADFYKRQIIYQHLTRTSQGNRKKMFAARFRKVGIPFNIPFEEKLERFIDEYVKFFLKKISLKSSTCLSTSVDDFLNNILSAPHMSQWILTKELEPNE